MPYHTSKPFICHHCGKPGMGSGARKYHIRCARIVEAQRKRDQYKPRGPHTPKPTETTKRQAWLEVTCSPRGIAPEQTIVQLVSHHRINEIERFDGRDKTTTHTAIEFAREWAVLLGWPTSTVDNCTPYS